MNLLLAASSTLALALLVAHSWRTRGKGVTLAFFLSALAFGILRGNAIWLLCRLLSPEAAEALKPYIPQEGLLPPIGHESPQVAVGWVFSLYLAWTISELILRRLPRFAGRVFMIAGLASLFMLTICWCMETTAVAVGWWYWTLPTKTALFGNVNVPAMEGWFSVVPDFLIPFLVIACSASRSKLRWLWLLAFPAHLVGHLTYRWVPYAYLVYNAMELLVVALMMFSGLRISRGEVRERDRASGAILATALAIFFGVVATANAAAGQPALALTALPMLMLCLLAWRRLPIAAVTAASLAGCAGWAWMGPRALWSLAPIAAYGFLARLERWREPAWLRLAPAAATAALAALCAFTFEADKARTNEYVRCWKQGDLLALAGKEPAAEEWYDHADRLRPHEVLHFHMAVRHMTLREPGDLRLAADLFGLRMPRVVRELTEIVRRDPEWIPPREGLARFHLLAGRIDAAADEYREMQRLRPRDAEIAAMLGYFLLRAGDVKDAEAACEEALRPRTPPVMALIDLGVIRFSEGRDTEARALWEQALAREPKHPTARANLERLTGPPGSREIDVRFLAGPSSAAATAPWTNNLAALGTRWSPADRVRLLIEATQFDPAYLPARLNLVQLYLDPGPLQDREQALWHARQAVAVAREPGAGAELPGSLLALARALIACDRPAEARLVLEEGRAKAPAAMRPAFDRWLEPR